MPAITPRLLVGAIIDAIEQSGEVGILTSTVSVHPRIFVVFGKSEQPILWIYAWTLTHGGRPQLRNEYRIQMTSVESPLRLNPNGPTLLVGYEPSLKMFAGFDLNRHRKFTAGSPSVQIDISALREALLNGLAFHRKGNNEIAIAIRPDLFMAYARNGENLHRYGHQDITFNLLTRASSRETIEPVEMETLNEERKRQVRTISQISRDANFRQSVLNAYGHRCAVTRMQLRLIEAAHILPVPAAGSQDHICNGIALSPTYHRAFDKGLIFLDENYIMKINPEKEAFLVSERIDQGLIDFKSSLGKIHLPPDRQQWPNSLFIRRANHFRRIPIA